jgi:hypothetical protein
LIPVVVEESSKADKKAFVISQKGRKMKKSDVMQALKQEYLRDANWNKDKKQELCDKYGVTYSQLYKLHWDWKEKEIRDRQRISDTAEAINKETRSEKVPCTRSMAHKKTPELVKLFKIVRVLK